MMSIFCNTPKEHTEKFGWHACENIADYCDDNYVFVNCTDIDTIIGGYQVWLKGQGFKIVVDDAK